eukprot:CAMPEP_0117791214 /NCGR_PEP_ID=MMETSP0948-20121206/8727_1 /TAXON_ID=44440 /ORGANISM="Chattonella subsalsa, Strain CCMP2191" /LENGTH=202 /DNA_ID=CAMNT_0005621231 /DNA_START=121 /DNA_END=731 /DNA_ORIENTATION=+
MNSPQETASFANIKDVAHIEQTDLQKTNVDEDIVNKKKQLNKGFMVMKLLATQKKAMEVKLLPTQNSKLNKKAMLEKLLATQNNVTEQLVNYQSDKSVAVANTDQQDELKDDGGKTVGNTEKQVSQKNNGSLAVANTKQQEFEQISGGESLAGDVVRFRKTAFQIKQTSSSDASSPETFHPKPTKRSSKKKQRCASPTATTQ